MPPPCCAPSLSCHASCSSVHASIGDTNADRVVSDHNNGSVMATASPCCHIELRLHRASALPLSRRASASSPRCRAMTTSPVSPKAQAFAFPISDAAPDHLPPYAVLLPDDRLTKHRPPLPRQDSSCNQELNLLCPSTSGAHQEQQLLDIDA